MEWRIEHISRDKPELALGIRLEESYYFKGCRTEACQVDYGQQGKVLFQCGSTEMMVEFKGVPFLGHHSAPTMPIAVKAVDLTTARPPHPGDWRRGESVYLNRSIGSDPTKSVVGKFGFAIGEGVTWTGADDDVPKGSRGSVVGFTDNRLQVSFPKGTWHFLPAELLKALIPCTSWIPVKGDTVHRLDGKQDRCSDSDWVLKAGECAIVKEVDEDGDFRLMNPSGETSECFHPREFYGYTQAFHHGSHGVVVGFVSSQQVLVKFDKCGPPIKVQRSHLNSYNPLNHCSLTEKVFQSVCVSKMWPRPGLGLERTEVRRAKRLEVHRSCQALQQPKAHHRAKGFHRHGCHKRR